MTDSLQQHGPTYLGLQDKFQLTVVLTIDANGYLVVEEGFDAKMKDAVAGAVETFRRRAAAILGPMIEERTMMPYPTPAQIIEVPGTLTAEQAAELREGWEAHYRGGGYTGFMDEYDYAEDAQRFALWLVLGGALLLCLMPLLTYKGPW